MDSIEIKAFAKVNLGLRILGKRKDGYHNIETFIQTISIWDKLSISLAEESIVVNSDEPDLPVGEANLCHRACEALGERIVRKIGVKIEIEKNIPMGAGMGGGSSDAAAVLVGLNILLSLNLSNQELIEIAQGIGSDVPFFIEGGTAFVSGRGEKIESVKVEPYFDYVVVFPGFSIDTDMAYKKIKFLTRNKNYIKLSNYRFDKGDVGSMKLHLRNDFEEVMLTDYVNLREIRQFLIQNGASMVSLSGSGSSIYGIFDDLEKMNVSYNCLKQKGYWVKKAHSVKSSEIPQFLLK
jgi:4-diphosphocytidyl-2-C-methyl-D-erythritol kinase